MWRLEIDLRRLSLVSDDSLSVHVPRVARADLGLGETNAPLQDLTALFKVHKSQRPL